MSYSPNSLRVVILGIIQGIAIGVIKGDIRGLDYSSYGGCSKGPSKEETMGNTLHQKEILAKQGTYVIASLRTGILNNYHIHMFCHHCYVEIQKGTCNLGKLCIFLCSRHFIWMGGLEIF